MKIGLSLGGGGALGYAHIGVIQALEESGVSIDMVNGTSMGAIVGGAYALYGDSSALVSLVEVVIQHVDVRSFNIFRYWDKGQGFLRNWVATAICDMSILRKSILSHSEDRKALTLLFGEKRFEDTRIPFSSVAVDLINGEIVVLDRGRLIDGILPSMSIPGIFPPVEFDQRVLVDGFVLADVPVAELRRKGADFVIAVKLRREAMGEYETGFDILNIIESMKVDTLSAWELEQADFAFEIAIPDLNYLALDDYERAISRGYQVAVDAMPELQRRLSQGRG